MKTCGQVCITMRMDIDTFLESHSIIESEITRRNTRSTEMYPDVSINGGTNDGHTLTVHITYILKEVEVHCNRILLHSYWSQRYLL
jgi:hypothetical protein